ncbi:hypothetical protein ABHF33_10670 [Chitinibacter sp. FCG-7]|uniref:Transposase n=1 Tax=Chitinibacter mangrovi TaxID=3153927 RepID=A0AAU7F6Q9_9NEIS
MTYRQARHRTEISHRSASDHCYTQAIDLKSMKKHHSFSYITPEIIMQNAIGI